MVEEFTPSLCTNDIIAGAPEGFDAYIAAKLCREHGRNLLWIVRDDARLESTARALKFFAPEQKVIIFPAFDCLPYDRLSPHPSVASARAAALGEMVDSHTSSAIILTTLAAALQKLPPLEALGQGHLVLRLGGKQAPDALRQFLEESGYHGADHVAASGEYAMRGGLMDIFPPGEAFPFRIDFFGDQIEEIRRFNPETQRSSGKLEEAVVRPASEIRFDDAHRRRFCAAYAERFGVDKSPLYAALSAGARFSGQEHWLPLFYPKTSDLFSCLPDAPILLDDAMGEEEEKRRDLIEACYQARCREAEAGHASGQPLPPDMCHLSPDEAGAVLATREARAFSPFIKAGSVRDAGGRAGANFTAARLARRGDLFQAVKQEQANAANAGKPFIIAAWSEGSLARLASLLEGHGLEGFTKAASFQEAMSAKSSLVVFPVEAGFEGGDFILIGEQDIFGQRLASFAPGGKAPTKRNLFLRPRAFSPGDLVVHLDHGIGRFEGLKQIEAAGAKHDCFELVYAEGRKLFLPVENAELIARHGGEGDQPLDRLGGAGWQARRAKVKKGLLAMAAKLIATAAERLKTQAIKIEPPAGIYEEFCARFPFEETPDQHQAMEAVLGDMTSGRLMDRLICGDAGFGKTEIALRAALCHVMAGRQVALIAPTTLLVRQHLEVFRARFEGFSAVVAGLSRLTPAAEARKVKAGLTSGEVDIVIGTHALLSKGIAFKQLGLLITDEEQHFGVAHKERLKEIGKAVNVMAMSATPIPRTLQLALAGARDMSIIATPPQGRLAIKTFTGLFDPPALSAALRREKTRGGQSFIVCPHRRDLPRLESFLRQHLPDLSFITAHGKMASRQLEEHAGKFYDGGSDILLSTPIIESGLDIPRANTIIIYRAHRFGLAQAHQLRGRVGRGRIQGYAYLTVSHEGVLHAPAGERLRLLQSLSALGSGFSLAAQDLDMRGAGNLLGEAQSGHVREVGHALYQEMLTQALAEKSGKEGAAEKLSPIVRIEASALIPEAYIPSLDLRLELYRRLAALEEIEAIEAFAAEMIDRFGALPEPVEHLLAIMRLKQHCREAGIAKLEAGGQGLAISFSGQQFPDAAKLAALLQSRGDLRLRPDHRLLLQAPMADAAEQIAAASELVAELAQVRQSAPDQMII